MIKKVLFIIGLCILPMIGQADTKEDDIINDFGNDLNGCKLYYSRTNAELDRYDKQFYQQLVQNIDETTYCYQKVFDNILIRYFDITNEQAHQFSDNVIHEAQEQYRFLYKENKYCNAHCQRHLNLNSKYKANNSAIREYLFLAILLFHFAETNEDIFIKYKTKSFFDYISYEHNKINKCKTANKDKICSDYDDNQCLKNNLKILNDVKICYSKQLNNLLVQYYGKTNKEAEKFTQNLWELLYKHHSFVFGKNKYTLKESELVQEYSSTVATLDYLYTYLDDMMKFIEGTQ